jgi:predicted O-methyltransferase YrrM
MYFCRRMSRSPEEIEKHLRVPSHDTTSPVKPEEARFMYSFLKEKGLSKTLETGLAYGRSASHIIAATEAKHIAIDPFQANYDSLGLKNLEALGMTEYLTHIADYSHNALPSLHKEGQTFDFIFIDGDHKFDGELIDFYYADLLLEANGYVLLHDTWMRSTRLLMSFIETNRKDYKKHRTPLRNFALYQKVGTDTRNGMFFKEFYTSKGTLSHYGISYLTREPDNAFKSFLRKVKDLIK